MFRRHRQAQQDKAAAEGQLQERSVIDRAKAILIRERRLSEPDAYRWRRRRAMSLGKRVVEVAAMLVRAHEEGGDVRF
ncbi:MAG TPA: ANTAR domain-containing protein [Acetobacteraceae bacterium]|nr:ANTAR domain-containing protein [Acetobacteraceae bacterium]